MGIRISNSQTILCVLLKVKAVKMDNQQRANIQHVELWRRGLGGERVHVCMWPITLLFTCNHHYHRYCC